MSKSCCTIVTSHRLSASIAGPALHGRPLTNCTVWSWRALGRSRSTTCTTPQRSAAAGSCRCCASARLKVARPQRVGGNVLRKPYVTILDLSDRERIVNWSVGSVRPAPGGTRSRHRPYARPMTHARLDAGRDTYKSRRGADCFDYERGILGPG